jgi:hypothetical protein
MAARMTKGYAYALAMMRALITMITKNTLFQDILVKCTRHRLFVYFLPCKIVLLQLLNINMF